MTLFELLTGIRYYDLPATMGKIYIPIEDILFYHPRDLLLPLSVDPILRSVVEGMLIHDQNKRISLEQAIQQLSLKPTTK